MVKKSSFILLIFIFLFGGVSATISNVHIEPLYPNLSSNLIKVYADVSDVSKATLYYRINGDNYSSPFSISKGVSSFIYEGITDNFNVIYWIETTNSSGDKESTIEYNFTYDGSAPVIKIIGDDPLIIEINSSYNELGATASDSIYGDLTSSIVTSGSVDTNTLGEYTITYTVSDPAGNTATATRIVKVVEISSQSSSSNSGGGSSGSGGGNSVIIINETTNASNIEVNPTKETTNTETKGKITGGVIYYLGENKVVGIIIGIVIIGSIIGYYLIKKEMKRKLYGK